MKIAVLSDTHIPYAARELPSRALKTLENVDAIIHAGDFQEEFVLEQLHTFGRVYGVCGNMDSSSIREKLPMKKMVKFGGFTIGITHGGGSPAGLEERVFAVFKDERVDAIVYGHSHTAHNVYESGILLFNPGSPTDKRFAPFQSMGMLIVEEKISGEIIKL